MYFDHSASYPINKKVLKESFKHLNSFYNSNSKHSLGIQAKKTIDDSERAFLDFFDLPSGKVTFTSGASESNNMVLLGSAAKHPKGKIIISPFEHSSVLKPISYLQHQGHQVLIAPVDKTGKIILDQLLAMLDENTFLVSIAACESELGISQDIDMIAGKIKKIYPQIIFHSDITQAINKYFLTLKFVDYASFSGHKFGSLKGIGGLIHNTKHTLRPLMYGNDLKPGTKPVELIYNMKLALKAIDYGHKDFVLFINNYLRKRLAALPLVKINSPVDASPYILNISLLNLPAQVSQALLSKQNIYLSTQSACVLSDHSRNILKLTHSKKRALTSLRISLSHEHTWQELNLLLINLERLCQR